MSSWEGNCSPSCTSSTPATRSRPRIPTKARTLRAEHSARSLGAPSTRDVIDAITRMQRRVHEHGQDARTPTIDQVRVERDPEEYLLDCRIAVQTRDADFRIADPFGIGFSRTLEGVFSRRLAEDENLQTWMTNWLQSLANPSRSEHEQPWVTGSYDTPENRRRYPKLVQALTPARGASHRSVTDIYAATRMGVVLRLRNPQPRHRHSPSQRRGRFQLLPAGCQT